MLAHMFPVLGQIVRCEAPAMVATESAELKSEPSLRFARCSAVLRSVIVSSS